MLSCNARNCALHAETVPTPYYTVLQKLRYKETQSRRRTRSVMTFLDAWPSCRALSSLEASCGRGAPSRAADSRRELLLSSMSAFLPLF